MAGLSTKVDCRIVTGCTWSNWHIVLVTSSHVASNPRLVKEADALAAAGARVTVVAPSELAEVRRLDRAILDRADWHFVRVPPLNPLEWFATSVVSRACRMLAMWLDPVPYWIAKWHDSRDCARLGRAARGLEADLFIAHNPPALPAAAGAAKACNASYAFDAEDFHPGEFLDSIDDKARARSRTQLEDRWLPGAAYVSAAAPLIARAYARRYGIGVTTIINSFQFDAEAAARQAEDDGLKFYWFSQTIGPGRGLEEVLSLLGTLALPLSFDLRGAVGSDYAEKLRSMAARNVTLNFLPTANPDSMVKLCQGYSFGICVERKRPEHRNMCLTNKILTYLAAGLPVVLSRTDGQELFASTVDACATVLDLNHLEASARVLRHAVDMSRQIQYQSASEAGISLDWGGQREQYLDTIGQALGRAA